METINLVASENVMSPLAELVYLNDMGSRYAEGTIGKRYYKGTVYIDEIERELVNEFSEILGARYVDVRPISGTIANMAVYAALARNKVIAAVPTRAGGHISHNPVGAPGILGIKVLELPWNDEEWNIDVDRSARLIREEKPSLVVVGASLYLFPHPVKELSEVAREVGAYLMHDTAHVFGLVIGGVFPNPLREEAHIITTSTHKTFPGPQGGLIAANLSEEDEKLVSRAVFPGTTSNYHLHRYAATLVTLWEMKVFGNSYARAVVENAKTLAEELYNLGFKVAAADKGFTATHQVAVDVSEFGGGEKVSALLEASNIIVNKNMMPWDRSAVNPSGIRIGVQEVTRFGMGRDDMREIARLIHKVVVKREDPAKVREEVIRFREQFRHIKYGFTVDEKFVNDWLRSMLVI